MEELERAEERLENIRSVEPILGALRTISMGSWKAALRQSDRVQQYEEWLSSILPSLLPLLPVNTPPSGRYLLYSSSSAEREKAQTRVVAALVVGSERGLVGRFNRIIVEKVEAYLAEQIADEVEVELAAMGGRVRRLLQRRGYQLAWSDTLSIAALPSFERAFDLTRRWLTRYEARELDAVDLIYNAYHGMDKYHPTVTRLIPPSLSLKSKAHRDASPRTRSAPIIETDPLSLYTRVVEQQTAIGLYRVLLESASAEHAARYRLLESATQNIERLIEELTLTIQTARQQEITQEMEELAVGAGMLGSQKS
ncbi:MAG: hypothetical protein DRI48_00065 [Chloroflexi bacterium]|nr:MAG: hypothetical protein DRI48_00065 [Chloroflexota bacterium]